MIVNNIQKKNCLEPLISLQLNHNRTELQKNRWRKSTFQNRPEMSGPKSFNREKRRKKESRKNLQSVKIKLNLLKEVCMRIFVNITL